MSNEMKMPEYEKPFNFSDWARKAIESIGHTLMKVEATTVETVSRITENNANNNRRFEALEKRMADLENKSGKEKK